MEAAELQHSLRQYHDQLEQVAAALAECSDAAERESLESLQSDLEQLVSLTRESLAALAGKVPAHRLQPTATPSASDCKIDDEYALFMAEMAETGAYDNGTEDKDNQCKEQHHAGSCDDSDDIEEELTSLPGMKCAVYHTHRWGGQPSLHNAMVSAVVPREEEAQFKDLQVRVLFTHPTHAEMLPCPFYLDGDCRFSDEQCRYSHGELVSLSNLQEAVEPTFESMKIGTRVLVKLKPPHDEEISLTKKSSEKYYIWHGGIVKGLNLEKRMCTIQLEQGMKSGEKNFTSDEFQVHFEELFPLNDAANVSSDSEDSLSDTEYPEVKAACGEERGLVGSAAELLVEKSLQYNGPAMGEWERHTRGIGSKLMFAMGYVAGTGLGVSSEGRLEPVPARVLPVGKSLDHCMMITEKMGNQDPLKVTQKLKKLQKKEEERNIRAYEREKEKERRNVFNFLNKTLGDKMEEPQTSSAIDCRTTIKQTTSKNLNIEQFKITEELKRVEKEVVKLKNSLYRHAQGSNIHKNISMQLAEKCKELDSLKNREQNITQEQTIRKDKQKLSLF